MLVFLRLNGIDLTFSDEEIIDMALNTASGLYKYEDILKDKGDLVFIISTMIPIYQMYEHHTQVLECNQWLMILERSFTRIIRMT